MPLGTHQNGPMVTSDLFGPHPKSQLVPPGGLKAPIGLPKKLAGTWVPNKGDVGRRNRPPWTQLPRPFLRKGLCIYTNNIYK